MSETNRAQTFMFGDEYLLLQPNHRLLFAVSMELHVCHLCEYETQHLKQPAAESAEIQSFVMLASKLNVTFFLCDVAQGGQGACAAQQPRTSREVLVHDDLIHRLELPLRQK